MNKKELKIRELVNRIRVACELIPCQKGNTEACAKLLAVVNEAEKELLDLYLEKQILNH